MIEIKNLEKKYGEKMALRITDLSFEKGVIYTLIGNNGAGKTTLLRCILDLILPSQGSVYVNQKNVQDDEKWKFIISSYLDEKFMIDFLTPEEYFYFLGSLKNYSKISINERLGDFKNFFNDEILNQKKLIRDFSKGNIQKIGIVSCFILEPEMIILDEPFANLDPSSKYELNLKITQYKQRGIGFILSSHNLDSVAEISDRIILMEKGEIIKNFENNPENIAFIDNYFKKVPNLI
jgi:ABC-2 type transport system ATP-binding protein